MSLISDSLGKVGISTPSFNLGGVTNVITIMIFVFIFAIVIGVLIFLLFNARTYSKSIVIYENIAGQGYVQTRKDKARVLKLGDGGEELLYLRKHKVYRSAYGKKIGKNTYLFVIGSDGYWYNSVMGDFDFALRQLGWKPTDRDMRYMHVAIRRNMKDRFEKQSWLSQNAAIIMSVGLVVVMMVLQWLLMDKYLKTAGAAKETMVTAKEVLVEVKNVIGALEGLKNSGSGFVQAGFLPALGIMSGSFIKGFIYGGGRK